MQLGGEEHFQNCVESAVESSNLDSLRTLARSISLYEKKLDGIMASLPL
jgi:hypothetical protein